MGMFGKAEHGSPEVVSCYEMLHGLHTAGFVTVWVISLVLFILSMTLVGAVDYMAVSYDTFKFFGFEIAGNSMPPMEVFTYTFGSTVHLLWKAGGVWILVDLIVVIFSGFLPYLRLVLVMVVWFFKLGSKTREWLLWMLDLSGKLQLINFYLIFLIGSSLGLTRQIAPTTLLDSNLLKTQLPEATMRIALDTRSAIYLFIVAVIVSMALAQYTVSMHYWFSYGSAHSKRTGRMFKDRYVANYRALAIATLLSLAMAGFFLWAITTSMFKFTYGGLLGPLMVPNNSHVLEYSLVSVGTDFPNQAYVPHNAGATFMSVYYFFLCIVGPVLLFCAIVFNWYAAVFNMSSLWRRRALRISQFTAAYSACEVFIVCFGIGTINMNSLLDTVMDESAAAITLTPEMAQMLSGLIGQNITNLEPLLNDICGPNYTVNLTKIIDEMENTQLKLVINELFSYLGLSLPIDQSHCISAEVTLLGGYWALIAATFIGLFAAITTSILLQPKVSPINTFQSKFPDEEMPADEADSDVEQGEPVSADDHKE